MRRPVGLCRFPLVFLLCLLPSFVFAQDSYRIQGEQAMKKGEFAEAITQFQASLMIMKRERVSINAPEYIAVEKLKSRAINCKTRLDQAKGYLARLQEKDIREKLRASESEDDARTVAGGYQSIADQAESALNAIREMNGGKAGIASLLLECASKKKVINSSLYEALDRISAAAESQTYGNNYLRDDIVPPRLGRKETVSFPLSRVFVSSEPNFSIKGASDTYFAYVPNEHWGVLILRYVSRDLEVCRYVYCSGWDEYSHNLSFDVYKTSGEFIGTLDGIFTMESGRYQYTARMTNTKGKTSTTYYMIED